MYTMTISFNIESCLKWMVILRLAKLFFTATQELDIELLCRLEAGEYTKMSSLNNYRNLFQSSFNNPFIRLMKIIDTLINQVLKVGFFCFVLLLFLYLVCIVYINKRRFIALYDCFFFFENNLRKYLVEI